jgi:hypothetical protein
VWRSYAAAGSGRGRDRDRDPSIVSRGSLDNTTSSGGVRVMRRETRTLPHWGAVGTLSKVRVRVRVKG